jgi:hypothetical protein
MLQDAGGYRVLPVTAGGNLFVEKFGHCGELLATQALGVHVRPERYVNGME